ncbi:sugar phosphate isomerase/epimerase [Thermaerobacter sp. FW80]|uniref:cobamide remodeling phosphodiesterase CbiR n=1 Tax=Thermaerobacter sp. FW80 TaxID=2546351 RepID=UPI0010750BDD|nr:cobamide remodeling phosphodiesterase CbiR [Thermaerobacter sp. FW80]QBS36822.1 sugar phosphate isomerase/epimerase [Thermaerobacter sp. FW80]
MPVPGPIHGQGDGAGPGGPGSSAPATPPLSLPCRSLWRRHHRPEDPDRFLQALRDEARRRRAQGAEALEFHADACVLDPRYAVPAPWAEAAAILAAEGLAATVHLPYAWPDLTALDAAVWEGSVTSVVTALRATAPLRPQLAAVHPANHATQALVQATPAADRPALLDQLAARLVAALRRILAEAPPEGAAAVALENLEGVPWPLFEAVCREAGVAVCLDVGHAISNGDDPLVLCARVGPRLRGVHLHDAVPPPVPARAAPPMAVQPGPPTAGRTPPEPGAGAGRLGRAHLPLGAGHLPLRALVAVLRGAGFRGPVVLELDDEEALQASAARWREAASS